LRDQVVRLAGMYKVKEAVPYLLEILDKRDLFRTEWFHKTSVVKALGDIADPRALDILTRLYRSRTMLYRSSVEELKVEIFRSLSNYPQALVRPLLEQGLASKNKEIRAISEKLLKHRENGNVPGKDN